MGCACLRGGGRHWADRGARRVAAGQRQQQVHLAGQPGLALPAARSQHLRPCRDADAVHLSDREGQSDANPDPNAVSDSIGVGQPIGDRDRQRVTDAMSIAVGDGLSIAFCDGITVTEWERETLGLALGAL